MKQTQIYDAVIVGSGAGGSAVAYTLAKAGYKVALLEKGRLIRRSEFSKDELAYCRREIITPNPFKEYHLVETFEDGLWQETPTYTQGWGFWNGNIVGGSSNLMSGMFHRMHPNDFKLKSIYGDIEGANVVDWPIDYQTLEPYYAQCETLIGISGHFKPHPFEPPRSTPNFPQPPTKENTIVKQFDSSCQTLGLSSLVTPRAILSQQTPTRNACYYSNFCGSYGCSSGAKGSAREALIMPALATGNLTLLSHTHVKQLLCDKADHINAAVVVDTLTQQERKVYGRLFVVAAQAHESVRLLLNSANRFHPHGLANSSGELGKNLLFSGGGFGEGALTKEGLNHADFQALMQPGLFFNRSLLDFYEMKPLLGNAYKGGLIEFMFSHQNIIGRAVREAGSQERLLWGEALSLQLQKRFKEEKRIRFELFNDWLPHDNCYVTTSKTHKDCYGMPVGKLRISGHPHDLVVGNHLAQEAVKVLEHMGASNITTQVSADPSPNLIAGGCRFGTDPRTSVLNPHCQAHDIPNLFVADAAFMPTGGSVPYTWTIYANALRIGEHMVSLLRTMKS